MSYIFFVIVCLLHAMRVLYVCVINAAYVGSLLVCASVAQLEMVADVHKIKM